MTTKKRKLLVIGVDQAIPFLLEKYLHEGNLPHIASLIDRGVYANGYSCPPCDTPTNWTTIATGTTTAHHGATSFYLHIPGEPFEKGLSLRSRTQLQAVTQAEYFWEAADRQNLTSFVINYPAGWGAPMKRGVMTRFTWPIPGTNHPLYSPPQKKEYSIKESLSNAKELFPHNVAHHIDGKLCFKFPDPLGTPFLVQMNAENRISSMEFFNDTSQSMFSLKPNVWSDWISCEITNLKVAHPCLYRFMLIENELDHQSFSIQLSAIYNQQGWTIPEDFAPNLIKAVPFQDQVELEEVEYMFKGSIDPFLKYAHQEVKSIADIIDYAQKEIDWDVCFFHVHHLDSINHKMLAEVLPDFPKYKPKKAEQAEGNIRIAYQIVDDMVGELQKTVIDENTIVCLLADHGAIPAWKIVNLAKVFHENELLCYNWVEEKKRHVVDWSTTQVFPYLEPPYIWINRKGRDPNGIVPDHEYEAVRSHIIQILENLQDPETDQKIMAKVARKEDLADLGQDGDRIGDIVYFLNPPYQIFDGKMADLDISEITKKTLKREITYDAKRCFGAHAYYLPDTEFYNYSITVPVIIAGPGVKKLGNSSHKCQLQDIAPTLAHLLKIEPPKDATGKILEEMVKYK